jgi:hypothetical protein
VKDTLSWDRYEVQPVKDRSRKVTRRKSKMPVNGIAMKRLLIERAAKVKR